MATCEHCAIEISIPTAESLTLTVLPPPLIDIAIGCGGVHESADYYDGEYVVTPLAWEQTVLNTDGLLMRDDVTVLEIPYYRSSNPHGGDTIFIGYSEG